MKKTLQSEITENVEFRSLLRSHVAGRNVLVRFIELANRLWSRFASRSGRNENHLHVVEMVALGEKRFVAVVEYGSERFLLGGAQRSVSLLSALRAQRGELAMSKRVATGSKRATRSSKKSASPSAAETRNIVALLGSEAAPGSPCNAARKGPSSASFRRSAERLA